MRNFILTILLINSLSIFGNMEYVYVKNGILYHPNGKELSLWGVNLQPNLSWEWNSLLKDAGVPWDAEEWKKITDESLDELELMECQLIRCHLTPADFTDDKGNLVETIYLDLLDYMIAEAQKREIYLSFAFLNHMGSSQVENSFMVLDEREKWIYDPDIVKASSNYITQLLKRKNPYNNITYFSDTSIVCWEISNEPAYYSHDKIKQTEYYEYYKDWLSKEKNEDSKENYHKYRKQLVLKYINGMYDIIRNTNAKHPIVWGCNWHRMIIGHEDVFEAIAESKVEVIAFCNYPGQDLVGQQYWNNPKDLTNEDYSDWLKWCYEDRRMYGWTRDEGFRNKAKIVYEFETFFNQSAYLYPAQAKLFRSLGVQMASMWHYSMPGYAQYRSGSHVLNLKCTPKKAASFIIAKEIFNSTPLYDPYNLDATTKLVTDTYMFSFKTNLSIYSSNNKYYYSNTIPPGTLPKPPEGVNKIIGYGNSPLVTYPGKGLYFINIDKTDTIINIMPDAIWLKSPSGIDGDDSNKVTELKNPNEKSLIIKTVKNN